jgi:hypothetical protein
VVSELCVDNTARIDRERESKGLSKTQLIGTRDHLQEQIRLTDISFLRSDQVSPYLRKSITRIRMRQSKFF